MIGLVSNDTDETRLVPGSHICALYCSDRDRLLSGRLGPGLSAGDKCACAVASASTTRALRALVQGSRLPCDRRQR
jgi:hypothetical protein